VDKKRSFKRSGLLLLVFAICFHMMFSGHLSARKKRKSIIPHFYVKFKAIGSMTKAGDFGDFIDRNEIYFPEYGSTHSEYDIAVTTPKYFVGYGGEIGFETERFGVGFAAEYIERNFHTDYQFINAAGGEQIDYTRDQSFRSVPIFLFVHYRLIDTSLLNIYLTLGEGVYLARYQDDYRQTVTTTTSASATSLTTSNMNHLGFHVGTTIDFKISRFLSLSMEAAYRRIHFKEPEADNILTDADGITETTGDLYYWTNEGSGESRFVIGEPDQSKFNWKGLPAVFDLDGFSFSVGLKITFDFKKKKKIEKVAPVD